MGLNCSCSSRTTEPDVETGDQSKDCSESSFRTMKINETELGSPLQQSNVMTQTHDLRLLDNDSLSNGGSLSDGIASPDPQPQVRQKLLKTQTQLLKTLDILLCDKRVQAHQRFAVQIQIDKTFSVELNKLDEDTRGIIKALDDFNNDMLTLITDIIEWRCAQDATLC